MLLYIAIEYIDSLVMYIFDLIAVELRQRIELIECNRLQLN